MHTILQYIASSTSKATLLFTKKNSSLSHRLLFVGVSSRSLRTNTGGGTRFNNHYYYHSSSHTPKSKPKHYVVVTHNYNNSTRTTNYAALLLAVISTGVGSLVVTKKIENKSNGMYDFNFLLQHSIIMNGMTSQCEEEKKISIPHTPSLYSFQSNNVKDSDPNAMSYYYQKITDVDGNDFWNQSHAVFGALMKKGLIERCNMYKIVPIDEDDKQYDSLSIGNMHTAPKKQEILLADIRVGKNLNGHEGIVHGGIISLLFDESFGWSFEAMPTHNVGDNTKNDDESTIVVTANLNVNYRKPLPAETNVVIRVYHEETKGRKVYLSARMESFDGSIVYSDATVLFIKLKKSLLV
jgi:acyl-coenzyme A thioesterase PaaI-like protein